ncbi:aspartate--tRNA ligase [Candidatus Woesearchaeota archaeon]|nr:aspartate--tRNA ligase [Candidatus Woesearchaeota archaeon]
MLRTHTCGELNRKHIGKEVRLAGWVDSIRTHGGVNFINIRDRYGVTQIIIDEKTSKELKQEYVIQVTGKVKKRPSPNKNISTGEIEIESKELKILNKCDTLPLDLSGAVESTDETRLKYRYLDLRKPENANKLIFRHKVVTATRDFLNKNSFLEIETPMLVKATPEGARDYLVPSRVNPGQFYALPQSPQLYKQILMVAGFDRYYQVARCLRDEDLRADRQPEHTQVDLEMSFVSQEDIRDLVEELMKHIFKEVKGIKLDKFPVFAYEEAMKRFGSDKPDIRFSLELKDVTEIAKKSSFKVFNQAEHVVGLVVDKDFSRKELDKLTDVAKTYKAKGLAYVKVLKDKFDTGSAKFLTDIEQYLRKELKLKEGQTVLFIADKKKTAQTALGNVRLALRDKLKLVKPDTFKFAWVNDFPLFAWNEDANKWEPEHHMFSMPKPEFIENFEECPEKVLGDLWDLTLNGIELASGSIRVSNPKVQKRIMKFVGFDEKRAQERFGFLLDAYKYGGPIHGGMGIGIDRVIALMLGSDDIREVIAFPKNKNAQCPMDGCPSEADAESIKELHLKIVK